MAVGGGTITENIRFFTLKVFWENQKWTKKMSKNGFAKILYPKYMFLLHN
jgi:hypothetical protein